MFGIYPKTKKNTANQTVYGVIFCGGDKRDRTADLLNAIQALSQLSYTPIFGSLSDSFRIIAYCGEKSRGYFKKFSIICYMQADMAAISAVTVAERGSECSCCWGRAGTWIKPTRVSELL